MNSLLFELVLGYNTILLLVFGSGKIWLSGARELPRLWEGGVIESYDDISPFVKAAMIAKSRCHIISLTYRIFGS